MNYTQCVLCDFPHAEERLYSEKVAVRGSEIEVGNLRRFVCPKCDATFMNDEQSRGNLRTIQVARGEERSFLLPNEIREWREGIGLTQRQAAAIFGGGVNAFSKYEKGDIVQTEAMDNLLWVSMQFPGIVTQLATRHHVGVPDNVLSTCGVVVQFSTASTLTYAGTATVPVHIASSTGASYLDWDKFVKTWNMSLTISSANDQRFALAA